MVPSPLHLILVLNMAATPLQYPLNMKLEISLLVQQRRWRSVSAAEHAELVQEVNSLRETLGQTQRMNDALQDRVKALEMSQTRMEAQLDLLIRIQHPAARPTAVAQVPFG